MVGCMNQMLEWLPDVLEAQVLQDALEAMDVLLATTGPITGEQTAILRSEIHKRAGDALQVRVHRADAIPRMPKGKLRAVISTLPSPEAECIGTVHAGSSRV
jgi:hypothetical protein